MTFGQRIGLIASVVWITAIVVIALSGPKEQFFFIFYIFGAIPVAAAWGIYLIKEERPFR